MSETYNNVPMGESMAERTEKEDAFWGGAKLVLLSFATLAVVFGLLWLMAEGVIGPNEPNAVYGHELHFLQPGGGPFD